MSGTKPRRWKTLDHFYWLLVLPCKLTQKALSFMHLDATAFRSYSFCICHSSLWRHVDDHRKARLVGHTIPLRYPMHARTHTHTRMQYRSRYRLSISLLHQRRAMLFLAGTVECLAYRVFRWWVRLTPIKYYQGPSLNNDHLLTSDRYCLVPTISFWSWVPGNFDHFVSKWL